MTDAKVQKVAFEAAVKAQAEAAKPDVSAFAMANAGSGKTKVLIDRVARLLLRREDGRPGASPDSILCITYTRAAANEMLTRLFRTLGDWAVKEDDKLKEALAKLEGRQADSYSREDLRDARRLFARALETPGGLRIETIHAFCARILRRFPLEAGVVPGFTEMEERDARALWQAAKDRAILEAAQDDPEGLALIAREAMNEGAASALDALRASGGAVMRFAERHDFDMDRMLEALRIDIGAPAETPDELVAEAMGPSLPREIIREALDALLRGSVTDQKRAEALEATLRAENPSAAWAAYSTLFLTDKGEFRAQNPYTKKALDFYPPLQRYFQIKDGEGEETARIRQLVDALQRARAFARTAALIRIGLPALEAYRDEKEKRGALDFDDLIQKTRQLLETDGMASWVLYKLDGSISHVLLDEAQDTSPEQWDLIRALTNEFGSGEGRDYSQDSRTMFIVGDEKQSIYSFQGAEPQRLLVETQGLVKRMPQTTGVDMSMSFRSGPEVLAFVDAVWNLAPPVDTGLGDVPPPGANKVEHSARRWDQHGSVEIWPIEPKVSDDESDAWERPVDVVRATSPKARLAKAVAEAVSQMISRREAIWDGGELRAIRPEDVLILVSKRQGGLFESLITALKAAGLPVAGADRLNLTDYIGVQDCLNLMRFATLEQRDLTLAEILRGPFCGLVDDDRFLFPLAARRAKGETLWQRVKTSDDPDVQHAARFLQGLIDRSYLPPYEFLSEVLDKVSESGQTGWEMINGRLGTPARDPIEAFLSRALSHDSAAPSSLQSFVAAMEAEAVEIKRDLAEAGREVRVMTVHGAKGLQAPVVILPDTTAKPKTTAPAVLRGANSVVWSPRKDTDTEFSRRLRLMAEAKAREEHRRLLYVALTRAQDRLIIAGHWHGAAGDDKAGYDKDSWYALCDAATEALDFEEIDRGRRYGKVESSASAPEAESATVAGILPSWALKPAPVDPKGRKLSAPTSLLGPKTRIVSPFDAGREARLRRGRAIHALLQYLPELAEEKWEAATEAYLSRGGDLTPAQREEMKAAALGVMRDRDLGALFRPGGRAEAAVIGRSPELPEGTVINGRVDRLIVTPEQVLVIDFKTDQPAPDKPEDVADSYVAQMAAYWAVLKEAFPDREVVAALCWTDGPRLMRLPDTQLLAVLTSARAMV